MRKVIAVLTIVGLVAGLTAFAALAATPKVTWKVGTNKTVKIRKGQKVKWVWAGDAPHNVKGKGFKSPTKSRKGYTYSHVFRTKGRFKITCTIHPGLMKTIVVVR